MLSKFDVFGVPIQMKFDDNSDNYRSFIGGLTSMILLIVSLIYTIYIFSLRIQGQLEPTANQISYITDFKNIQQDGSLIKVTFQKDDENQIDPFVSQGNILLPVLIKTSYTNDLISQIVLLNDSDTSLSDYESRYIDSQITLSFIHSQKSSKLSVQYEYYLLIVACQDSLLSVGQYCANQSQIDAFFNQQGNSVVFDFQFQTLDPLRFIKLRQFQNAYKDSLAAIELDDKNIKAHMLNGEVLCYIAKESGDSKKIDNAILRLTKAETLCGGQQKKEFEKEIEHKLKSAKKLQWILQQEEERRQNTLIVEQLRAMIRDDKELTVDQKAITQQQINKYLQLPNEKYIIPEYLKCNLTGNLLIDPVTTQFGYSYERAELYKIKNLTNDPKTGYQISLNLIYPNINLKQACSEFLERNPWAYPQAIDF